jgi:hypothetical protein
MHKPQGGGDVQKRNESDASALQAKLAKKEALKAEQAALGDVAPAKAPVVMKKKAKPKDDFDMLSAGLPAAKKRVK